MKNSEQGVGSYPITEMGKWRVSPIAYTQLPLFCFPTGFVIKKNPCPSDGLTLLLLLKGISGQLSECHDNITSKHGDVMT